MRYPGRTRGRLDGSTGGLTLFLLAVLAILTLAALAAGQGVAPPATVIYGAGPGKVTGLIISRQGDDILVVDESTRGVSVVTLTSTTQITSPTGFMNLDRKSQNMTSLIPGLIIAVHGAGGDRGNLMAHRISFHKSALRVATQINAGEVELKSRQQATAARAVANTDSIAEVTARARNTLDSLDATIKSRMSDLDTYDVKVSSVVTFASGNATLSDAGKRTLADLVSKGQGLNGYIIEVAGFADTQGAQAPNQRLSERRADAVVAYLTQVQSVPLRRIVNPTGLGTSHAVATNATAGGRAQNRRVEVKVLVNRGLAPSR